MKMFVYRIKVENKILEMMLILVIHPAGDFLKNLFILGFFFINFERIVRDGINFVRSDEI